MSFGRFCDGYIALHAPHLSPERLPFLQAELARVGVKDYILRTPDSVSEEDLEQSKYDRVSVLSVLKSLIGCIEHAKNVGWRRFAFLEDDVCFRPNFNSLWDELEPSVSSDDWGMLTLFRWPTVAGEYVVKEKFFERTRAFSIRHNICGHAILFQYDFYDHAIEALHLCIDNGWPADFMYGILSELHFGRVKATNKNLAGQRGGFVSTIQDSYKRGRSHYATFRSSFSSLDYRMVNDAIRVRNFVNRYL
jgi:hypothetical protein